MASAVSRSISWCVFTTGLVGASIGVADLRVELVVFCLIVASTSGLILLKMRAEALGRLDAVDSPRRVMVGAPNV